MCDTPRAYTWTVCVAVSCWCSVLVNKPDALTAAQEVPKYGPVYARLPPTSGPAWPADRVATLESYEGSAKWLESSATGTPLASDLRSNPTQQNDYISTVFPILPRQPVVLDDSTRVWLEAELFWVLTQSSAQSPVTLTATDGHSEEGSTSPCGGGGYEETTVSPVPQSR